jgi:hypothetical protein
MCALNTLNSESDAPAWSLGLAGLRPVAAQVYGRSMAGTCGVPRRSIAVMCLMLADRCPDGSARNAARQLPAVSSRRFPLRGNRACQRTVAGSWQDRADRADRSCGTGPGLVRILWRGCERWPCRSDFQGGTVSGACPAGGAGIGCGRPVAQRRARPGPGRQQDHEMQQDSAGLDGT